MNLLNDNGEEKRQKNKKIARIIIICIIILSIVLAAILGVIYYLKAEQLKVYIDGKAVKLTEGAVIVQKDTGNIYVSLKKFANYVGYKGYNGEYGDYKENPNACYVQAINQTEAATFVAHSNQVYKQVIGNNDYEYFTMQDNVAYLNNELYVKPEGAQLAFNIIFSYNAQTNTIIVNTLPYLVTQYNQKLATESGGYVITENFNEQKAILQGLAVVQNTVKKYGVLSTRDLTQSIIGDKYNNMQYVESNKEFIVTTSENKVGIINYDGVTKIYPNYDSLKLLHKNLRLYLASTGGKYGVIDSTNKVIIPISYDAVGIDSSLFPQDDTIENPLIFYDNCIPVRLEKKWGLFDKNGAQLLPIEYDNLGYIAKTGSNQSGKNLLLIPDYEAIIVCKDQKYGIFNSLGRELIPCALTDVQKSLSSGGKYEYYMTYEGQVQSVTNYLKAIGEKEVNQDEEENPNQDPTTNTINTNTTNVVDTNVTTNTTITNTATGENVTAPVTNTDTNVVQTNTNQIPANTQA